MTRSTSLISRVAALSCAWLLAAAAATAQAQAQAQAQDITALAFMSGSWREQTERELTQETWLGPNAGAMAAVNLSQRGARGSYEFLRIAAREGKLIYFASPEGRSPPTEFALKELAAERVVFENPAHDFPQRVIYRRAGEKLIARIEGSIGGQARSKEWVFERVR